LKNEFLWFFEKAAWYEFQLLLSLAFNLKKSLYNARITILLVFFLTWLCICLGSIRKKIYIKKFSLAQVKVGLFTKITFAVALVSFLCYSAGSAALYCRKREECM